MKYAIIFFGILVNIFLQSTGVFGAEEKVVRLIDLPQKEETEGTGSESIPVSTHSGKTEVQKTKEKKVSNEKGTKDEVEKTGATDESDEETPKYEKETVQGLINSYILETYKAQGDKILKDMDLSLQKKIPDIEKRIQAYTSIQTTLELRKNRIMKVNISEINKTLLISYFDYMIDSLEKKKEGLRE